ncbi:hypothetical protein P4V30_32805, partial [Bacillus thuringiensis]|nr:hypothetical protein [Bacillus thuringiensis]
METTQILFLIGIALIAIFSLIKYFKNTPKKPTTTKITIFVLIIFISISAIRGTASISEKNHAKDFFYKKSRYIKNKTALLYVKDVNSFAQCHVIL